MFKMMDKKIIAILRSNFLLNWPYVITVVAKVTKKSVAVQMQPNLFT